MKVIVLFFVITTVFFSSCVIEEDDEFINDNDHTVSDDNTDPKDDSGEKPDSDKEENNDKDIEEPEETGGIITNCTPGEQIECYTGPSGTKGVGLCSSGIATCLVDGSGWSNCEGEVLPTREICGDGIDQNCDGQDWVEGGEMDIDIDGDGYTYCSGDCCEMTYECGGFDPAAVNPGAYEIPENGIDDNCNGEIDEVIICDEGLALAVDQYGENAVKLAKAMGICEGLVSSELSLAGDPVSEHIGDEQCGGEQGYNKVDRMSLSMPYFDNKYQTFAVESIFGTAMEPLKGKKLAILSTGHWKNPTQDAACATLDGGDMKTASTVPEDWINRLADCMIPKAPSCGGVAPQDGLTDTCAGKQIPTVQDPVMLTLKLKVPTNANAFEFQLFFMSIEYPTTVCSSDNYNDFFIALLDSEYNEKNPGAEFQNPWDKNLAKDEMGNPVGVDLAPAGLFKACHPQCGMIGQSTNPYGFCENDFLLAGTGFEAKTMMGICSGHGGTGWLTTVGNVVPGEEITLRLAIWEQGTVQYGPDHSWDSTVVLDGFKWLPQPEKPGTGRK
jgi:hypothetical protein